MKKHEYESGVDFRSIVLAPRQFPPQLRNFSDFISACHHVHGDKNAISIFENNAWKVLTYKTLEQESLRVAGILQSAGLRKGDRVAILSASSTEWVTHFFATLFCGGVVVPLDIKLTIAEIGHIVLHSEPTFILASQALRETARAVRHQSESSAKVFLMDDDWIHDGILVKPFQPVEMSPQDLAVICYTSGTSGAPKGVEVSTDVFLFQAKALAEVTQDLGDKEVMMTILPLNHMYGLSGGLIYALRNGVELTFVHEMTPQGINLCLRERQVTQILAVPLYVKMVMRGISVRILEVKGVTAYRALRALMKTTKTIRSTRYKDFLFSGIRQGLGGKLKRFICGGSELDSKVYDFFNAINIPVYIGYGLTETGPVIATNVPQKFRRGSVGAPIPGVEIKIEDGEILTRGPHVTSGYFRDPELTREAFTDDGWFRTGDLGYLDEQGFLFVNGRKKALIVLSSGKKVHPEEVESVVSQNRKVKLVCVLGVRAKTSGLLDEQVTAVVLPTDEEIVKAGGDVEKLLATLKPEIELSCENLAPYKRPTQILIRLQPFVMTTSLKIKRDILLKELMEMP